MNGQRVVIGSMVGAIAITAIGAMIIYQLWDTPQHVPANAMDLQDRVVTEPVLRK